MEIKMSDMLKNGATVLAVKKGDSSSKVALCWWQGQYVSWRLDDHGNTYLGHYHGQNFKQAAKEFGER
jgi:hypothetical protein